MSESIPLNKEAVINLLKTKADHNTSYVLSVWGWKVPAKDLIAEVEANGAYACPAATPAFENNHQIYTLRKKVDDEGEVIATAIAIDLTLQQYQKTLKTMGLTASKPKPQSCCYM